MSGAPRKCEAEERFAPGGLRHWRREPDCTPGGPVHCKPSPKGGGATGGAENSAASYHQAPGYLQTRRAFVARPGSEVMSEANNEEA